MKLKNKFNYTLPKKETLEERKKKREKQDIVDDYNFIRDEKGILKIKKIGQHSMTELINSHSDEVGLKNIIKKYNMTGNAKLFNQKNLVYGDDTLIDKDEINKNKINAAIKEATKKIEDLQNQIKDLSKPQTEGVTKDEQQ